MLKESLKALPLTTLLIVYLFICGSLYLISYWSTFHIDISNFVGIFEIPKSFVFPFAVGFGISIFVANFMWAIPGKENKKSYNEENVRRHTCLLVLLSIFSLFIIVFLYRFFKYSYVYWYICPTVIAFFVTLLSHESRLIQKLVPDPSFRIYGLLLIILIPAVCVSVGKEQSIKILKNDAIQVVKLPAASLDSSLKKHSDSLELKLLGFLGDKTILSTTDNTIQYILNQSAFSITEIQWRSIKEKKSTK